MREKRSVIVSSLIQQGDDRIYFVMFLVNDLYGFVNWKRMEKRQMASL